jgi:hypothetical protein
MVSNVIDYITPTSTGNASDFGDLSVARSSPAACSNDTRAVIGGGYHGNHPEYYSNTIDYVTIASTGNASDFGNLTGSRRYPKATASTTYGYFAGGYDTSNNLVNNIDYITIASTGNASDFGDLTENSINGGGGASSTRGIFAAGRHGDGNGYNMIEYITFSTSGNATDFGDLAGDDRHSGGLASSKTVCLIMGGYRSSYYNDINKIIIASTGNATDFGDLTNAPYNVGGVSNGHGGLA